MFDRHTQPYLLYMKFDEEEGLKIPCEQIRVWWKISWNIVFGCKFAIVQPDFHLDGLTNNIIEDDITDGRRTAVRHNKLNRSGRVRVQLLCLVATARTGSDCMPCTFLSYAAMEKKWIIAVWVRHTVVDERTPGSRFRFEIRRSVSLLDCIVWDN